MGTGAEGLSAEEEREMVRFYAWKIVEVCGAFKFPVKVQATALLYLKRFYLRHSLMEFEPKSIMLTVVYVACKIDEAYVSAEALGAGIHQDPQLVLLNELAVLQALDFDLICHGPQKPLLGFLADWQAQAPHVFPQQGGHSPALEQLKAQAHTELPAVLLTDAPLLFPPSLLALAALARAVGPASHCTGLQPHFREYLGALGARAASLHPGSTEQGLEATVEKIVGMAEREGKPPEEARVRKIDRKLRHCKDPSLRQEASKKKKEKKEQGKAKRVPQEPGLGPASLEEKG